MSECHDSQLIEAPDSGVFDGVAAPSAAPSARIPTRTERRLPRLPP